MTQEWEKNLRSQFFVLSKRKRGKCLFRQLKRDFFPLANWFISFFSFYARQNLYLFRFSASIRQTISTILPPVMPRAYDNNLNIFERNAESFFPICSLWEETKREKNCRREEKHKFIIVISLLKWSDFNVVEAHLNLYVYKLWFVHFSI